MNENNEKKQINTKIEYNQVVWEITSLLQKAESLEEALRASLGEVVKAIGAKAGTIWFYNVTGDKRIYPSFTIRILLRLNFFKYPAMLCTKFDRFLK